MAYMKDSTGRRLDSFPVAGISARSFEDLEAERLKRLRPFHRALANRNFGVVDIWGMGHSYMEGSGVTGYQNRFTNVLGKMLRAAFPVDGVTTSGAGYLTWTTPGIVSNLPLAYSGVPTTNLHGIGRHAFELSTVDHKVTLTGTAYTRNFLVYTKKPGGGVGYYKVDGGAPVTFSTSNATIADAQLINVVGDGAVHTVEVGWSSGGPVVFNGMKILNGDHAKGIHITTHATASTRTQFWLDDTTHWDNIKVFQPPLIIITDMRNDWSGGVTSTQVKANLAAIITKINTLYTTNPKPSIVICTEYEDAVPTAPIEPWGNYVAKAKELENDFDTVLVFDLRPRFGDTVAAAGTLVSADVVHPSALGTQHWADSMLRFISPR